MYLKLSIINEIDNGNISSKDGWLDRTSEETDEYPLHLLVFTPSPLQNKRYPFLEVSQPRIARHTAKTGINFCGACKLNTPVYEMVLKHTLVQLVKYIQHEAREDVGMGKIGPEW